MYSTNATSPKSIDTESRLPYYLLAKYNKTVEGWIVALQNKSLEFLCNQSDARVYNGPQHAEAVRVLIKRKRDAGEVLEEQRPVFSSVVKEVDADDDEEHCLKRVKSGPRGSTELVRMPKSCCED